jgi:hypothetical protein
VNWLYLAMFIFAAFYIINQEDDDDEGGGMLQPAYERQ